MIAEWALRHLRRLFEDVDADATRSEDGRRPAPAAASGRRSSLRVLVVDDNPVNLMTASAMLALWGIEPLVAADGAEAVAIAGAWPLDLILMDLQMPVLDGLAATRQLRSEEREHARSRVPVVAYTSTPASRLPLRDMGLDDVLDKPCTVEAMQACLTRWCPRPGATWSLVRPQPEPMRLPLR